MKTFYDTIVVGSGAGGSVAASRLSEAGDSVLVLEEGTELTEAQLRAPISSLTSKTYRHAGAIPFFGPFTFPFGEARTLGGGTFINGGLIWRTPREILKHWASSIPNSIFASKTWEQSENKVIQELEVNENSSTSIYGNKDSILLKKAAKNKNWKTVKAPRAVVDCKNSNRCATGCPTGAKRSSLKNYLKKATANGATIVSGAKVVKILPATKNNPGFIYYRNNNKIKKIAFNRLVLSAGATQSPLLLKKSKLSLTAGNSFEFHLNFKITARFPFSVNAADGTIFTHQIQEFEKEGILMMASNFQLPYFILGLSGLSKDDVQKYVAQAANTGIFVSMTRPSVKASVHKIFGQTFGRWSWSDESFTQAKNSIYLLADLLFEAGAVDMVLPLEKTTPVTSLSQVKELLAHSSQANLAAVSVHGMSGCKMGDAPRHSTVDLNAQVWNQKGIYVVDSSILPSNMGESPQGTIMTAAHEIIDRWK